MKENVPMNHERRFSYHGMAVLASITGAAAIALQIWPGMELLSFMVSVAAVGGLIGGRGGYAEPERQQLTRSFQAAFEGLLLSMMLAYAFVLLANALPLLAAAAAFLNGHWPGLVISLMCLLMGLAGLRGVEADPKERP
jgi:hypothetical protein